MRKLVLLGILVLAFSLGAGCAVQKPAPKNWIPVGGSKADATVKMAYTWNPFLEKPIVQEQQAIALASQKCQTWGYERAEPFGGAISQCSAFSGGHCIQMTAIAEFQCVGGTTMTTTQPPARGREAKNK